jgi:hypothetical protein
VSLVVVSCIAGGALLLSGCGSVRGGGPEAAASASPAAVLDSGVEGTVVIGPLQAVGVPGASNSKPTAASVVVRAAPAADKTSTVTPGPLLARGVVSSDGRFQIVLAPGRYELTPESPSGQLRPVATIVTVLPHQFTKVVLQLDTGIR